MAQSNECLRLLILGAHPDDAEFHAGGLAIRYRTAGHVVRMISVTDGGAGHHQLDRDSLVQTRREEAAAAGELIGADYLTWDFPDGRLAASIEVRERIIREIRSFAPDLVLTHRTCDYHPDHRAVGQAVQDASYMVTVPLVCPDVPILQSDPVVAYMCDLFTKPCPLQPDVVIDIGEQVPEIVRMLAQHRSQVFEFLPFNQGIAEEVPSDPEEQQSWLTGWFQQWIGPRAGRFRKALIAQLGAEGGQAATWIEAYEISEYAGRADSETLDKLFCR